MTIMVDEAGAVILSALIVIMQMLVEMTLIAVVVVILTLRDLR